MIVDIIWLVAGLALILLGANALTDGSSAIASRMGVSDFVIGLTVVAMGTSAPELVVSLTAAIGGSAPIAVGNVIGSNIFNILVILGATALVRPVMVERSVLHTEIPIVILSSAVLLVLGNSHIINGFGENTVTRVDGIFLLVAFALYMRHTLQQGRNTPPELADDNNVDTPNMSVFKSILWIVGGLVMLIFGGDKFVDSASAIAMSIGISEAVTGLTIVAAGTSLPELATSIVAAVKGKQGLAVGNVIGSCIFNVFLVLGASAAICPLTFGTIGNVDLLTLVGASVLFWLTGKVIGERVITRGEGIFLLAAYVAFTTYLVMNATA